MRTIEVFKEITGQSFLKGVQQIANMDEGILLALLASSLRVEPHADPVGKEFLNKYNPIALLSETTEMLVDLVEDALPKQKPGSEVKKKKIVKK